MGIHHDRDAVWRDLCADFELEDKQSESTGLHRKRRRSQKKNHDTWRDRRLCGQVQRAVQMGLADCADPALQGLIVLSVEPTERSACLCVYVLAPRSQRAGPQTLIHHEGYRLPVDALLAKLNAVSGRLRSDVARSIHRKKTPQLIFQLQNEENNHEFNT